MDVSESAKARVDKATAPLPELAGLSDDELLQMRICDLKLKIPGTELESRIQTFYSELAAKGIAFKPSVTSAMNGFAPKDARPSPSLYLAHPRLKRLEEKMMMEVEGGTEAWCLSLLRHEMGHVLNHTYLLEKEKHWQKLFGPPSLEYSESFAPAPIASDSCATLVAGTRRAIPRKISPRPWRSGSRRIWTGGNNIKIGRPWRSWST